MEGKVFKHMKTTTRKTKAAASRKKPVVKQAAKTAKPAKESKTLVKFDPLQRYLSEISQYRLLTREEEVELGKRIQEQGDTDAAYRLVTSNLRLVVKCLK